MPIRAVIAARDIARVGLAQYQAQIQERAEDIRPAWDAVMQVLFAAELQLFATEGGTSEHSAWEPLSNVPSGWADGLGYRDWKQLHFPGSPILELIGKLSEQMIGLSGDHFEARGPRRLVFGSNYPVYSGEGHDLGGIHAVGRRTSPPMPARPPIRITQANADEIAETIMDYVLDAPRE